MGGWGEGEEEEEEEERLGGIHVLGFEMRAHVWFVDNFPWRIWVGLAGLGIEE
jgi:hypothetical protein